MSLPILFFITLIVVVILTLILVEKNNNITNLENWAESLRNSIINVELSKAKLQKEMNKEKEELCIIKEKLEEEREKKQEAIKTKEQLKEIVSKLYEEKIQRQKDFDNAINNTSLTIDKLNKQLLKLKNELNKTKEDYQLVLSQNEDKKVLINSLKNKNKELDNLVCELRNQIANI